MARTLIDTRLSQSSIREITAGDMIWVDVVPPSESAIKYLKERFSFPTLALEDCLSQRQISKMDVFRDCLFFVFHFNYYNKQTRISTKRQWSAFIGNNFLVTVHSGELKSIGELFQECQSDSGIRQEYLSKGSGYLLYRIIDRAIDSYFPVLDKILRLLEGVEDSVFDADTDSTMELSIIRRDIITQRMVMFPTRALLSEIRNKVMHFSRVDISENYDDLLDHLNRICQALDECKEVVEVFKDADYTLVTHRLNSVVRLLNVIATIILPFLAVSSIYGMNIPLPGGLEHGSISTFLVLLAIMLVLMGGMLYLFRRRHWI